MAASLILSDRLSALFLWDWAGLRSSWSDLCQNQTHVFMRFPGPEEGVEIIHHLGVRLEDTGSKHVFWTFWYWNTECENHFAKSEVQILALINLLWLQWSHDLALNLSFSIYAMGGDGSEIDDVKISLHSDFHESLVSSWSHSNVQLSQVWNPAPPFSWVCSAHYLNFHCSWRF